MTCAVRRCPREFVEHRFRGIILTVPSRTAYHSSMADATAMTTTLLRTQIASASANLSDWKKTRFQFNAVIHGRCLDAKLNNFFAKLNEYFGCCTINWNSTINKWIDAPVIYIYIHLIKNYYLLKNIRKLLWPVVPNIYNKYDEYLNIVGKHHVLNKMPLSVNLG